MGMYLHTEAFSASSQSQLRHTYDSLNKVATRWDKIKALGSDVHPLHVHLDNWCGTLAREDGESSKERQGVHGGRGGKGPQPAGVRQRGAPGRPGHREERRDSAGCTVPSPAYGASVST